MSIQPLVQLNRPNMLTKDTPLRQPCLAVTDFGDDLQRLVADLRDTLFHHKIAVGLAAPQIGVGLRVAAINPTKKEPESTLTIVNPEVVATSGKKDRKRESCMSLPGYGGDVERREKIHIRYVDQHGNPKELHASGFLARVLAHEIDHLDGYLYVDRMKNAGDIQEVTIFEDD